VNLSLAEFRALVAKAFRGAGYSWGLTEDAAFASMRLAEYGIDAGAAVVRLLTQTEGHDTSTLMPTEQWESIGDMLCPVCMGVTIADLGGCPDLSVDGLLEPLLLAPFLLSAIVAGDSSEGYLVEWDGGRCEVTAAGLTHDGSPSSQGGAVTITALSKPTLPSPIAVVSRVDLNEDATEAIEAFAHRTYAPATEASRTSGAGAGLLDAD